MSRCEFTVVSAETYALPIGTSDDAGQLYTWITYECMDCGVKRVKRIPIPKNITCGVVE